MPLDTFFPQIISDLNSTLIPQSLQYAIYISPVLLAVCLGSIFSMLWAKYVRSKFYIGLNFRLLEIRLPKETMKSPAAMETFLRSIHNTSDGSTMAVYGKGEIRPYYSLEIASFEGVVKFFIWCEDRRKGGVMAGLYSQFPGIEVHEVDDYARTVHFDPKTMKMLGVEFEFTKPDPYPIKTYIDFGLDKDPKEEYKIDPMTPLLEFLGSVGPNQQVWVQMLIRAHKGDQRKPGHLFMKTDLWQDEGKKIVNKMLLRDPKTLRAGFDTSKGGEFVTVTEGEKREMDAIERAISKYAFDVGIRCVYIAKKEFWNKVFGLGGIIGSFKQFGSEQLNGFKPAKRWHGIISDAWQDYKDIRSNRFSRAVLMAYKRRAYFYHPWETKPMVMNTEELATVYHFPGQVVAATPTLERIPSKKSQAPANLPI